MQKKTRAPAAKSVKRSMEPALRGSKALVSLLKSPAPNALAGASAGVALLGPDADGEAALVQADKAMHVRKTARRAKV